MKRVGLILAAGRSRRFGEQDKLLAPFHGRPVASWAARAMQGVPVDHCLVATRSERVATLFRGFEVLLLPPEADAQSESLRIGAARAEALGADQVLITLADMPLVGHGVLAEVAAACNPERASAATDGARRSPPACFPRCQFAALQALSGDAGAGQLLRELPEEALVKVAPRRLSDIDTPEDLDRLAQR